MFPVNFEFGPFMETVCANNDHESALMIIQILARMRRKGYIDTTSQVLCLAHCANCFADNDNQEFYAEFVQYMPNIVNDYPMNPFSAKAKAYYFALKHGKKLYAEIYGAEAAETNDIAWFFNCMTRLDITEHSHFMSLKDYLNSHTDLSPQEACEKYIDQQGRVPRLIKSGR